MKKIKIPFKCPYNQFSCLYVDTCGMTVEKCCGECEHYHNGVKATGAMPVLEKLYKWIKHKAAAI